MVLPLFNGDRVSKEKLSQKRVRYIYEVFHNSSKSTPIEYKTHTGNFHMPGITGCRHLLSWFPSDLMILSYINSRALCYSWAVLYGAMCGNNPNHSNVSYYLQKWTRRKSPGLPGGTWTSCFTSVVIFSKKSPFQMPSVGVMHAFSGGKHHHLEFRGQYAVVFYARIYLA